MPYEGHIAAQGLIFLNRQTKEWGITSNSIRGIPLSISTKYLYNRARKELHAFFNYCVTFHGFKTRRFFGSLLADKYKESIPVRHDRNLITAYATTGGRRSEIFRWTWHDDINFEKRMVRLGTRKTRSGEMRYRWIYMNDMLFDALRDQWKTRLPHSDYVFQNRDKRHPNYGDRYTARRKFMKGLCKRAGIKTFGFHALRRFFGSLLADKYKESIPVIQKLLGHASPNTTEKYIYNISQDSKRAVEQIELNIKIVDKKKVNFLN